MTVPVFTGLIWDTEGKAVEVRHIGAEPFYVVDDAGFLRHIPTEKIDRQVLELLKTQALEHREAIIARLTQMIGRDDLFTVAAIETSLKNLDQNIAQILQTGLPEDARLMLGLSGFRIIVDMHGDIVEVSQPGPIVEDE